jgi:parallel beta-helix repeat protein
MKVTAGTLIQERYLIDKLIARGGMGAVYKATDKKTGKVVALKQSLVKDQKLGKAFEREARMLARLRHPVLPVVSHHFIDATGQFLVMQYIPGEDLGTIIERQAKKFLTPGAIPWVLNWADQLLDALAYLHGQEYPVIHRDIKPQNLKITAQGQIKLLDFGLAKSASDHTLRSAVQSVRGYTPQYAPLEQIQGTGTEPCSDLYSLAATLYHLLTGQPPIDSLERVSAVLSGKSDPLRHPHEINTHVPQSISMVLMQAMEQEKEHRFASATAMRTALRMASQSRVAEANKATSQPKRSQEQTDSGSSGAQTIVATADRPLDPVPSPEPSSSSANASAADSASTSPPDLEQPYPTFVVASKGYAHFKTIGDAIMQAQPGTRIIVHPGTYKEGLLLDKHVEIIGDGPRDKIIIESTGSHTVQMQTAYALLRGVTLHARSSTKNTTHVAVDIPQGRLVIEDCAISSETQTCVAIHGAKTNPVLWRCTIHKSIGTGIVISQQASGIIEECDIAHNSIAGIGILQASNPLIRRCTIHHNQQDGIAMSEKSNGTVEDCDIHTNERAGITIKQASTPFIRSCTIHDQVKGYGISIHDHGEGVIEECTIFGNMEAGIGISQEGNPFIYRCQIHHEKQRGMVIMDNSLGTIQECDIHNNTRMGIGVGKYAQPTIRKCTIHACGQVGIFVWDNGGGTIESCTITENGQAGIEIGHFGNPIVRQCSINRNKQVAIVARKDGGGTVEACDLTDNRRGAWLLEEGSMVLGSDNTE